MKLIRLIVEHIFGKKYYANVINTRGTKIIEMSSYIFRTKREARRHREELKENRSYGYVDTISFRSREELL